jgi:quercetin dioxygenase-like cupin family protein
MRRVTQVGLLALTIVTAGGGLSAAPLATPFAASAEDVDWVPSEVVPGAHEARVGPTGQRLHRWPPNAETAWQQRQTSWDVVLLAGLLTVSLEGRQPRTLGPLSYVDIRSGVGHRLRCEGPAACLILGFSGQQGQPLPYEPEHPKQQSNDAPPAGVLFIDIGAAEWSPAPPPDGVEIGSVERNGGRAPWLPLIYPSAYFVYRLKPGARLPLNHARAESRGFTLQGTAVIDSGDGDKALPPGSMFGIPSGRMGWLECKDATCIVLATSRPPEWRSR